MPDSRKNQGVQTMNNVKVCETEYTVAALQKAYAEIVNTGYGRDQCNELTMHIAADMIRKQIPLPVAQGKWDPDRCPCCGAELSEFLGDGFYSHPTFLEACPSCYQRLKWGE